MCVRARECTLVCFVPGPQGPTIFLYHALISGPILINTNPPWQQQAKKENQGRQTGQLVLKDP